MQRDPHVYILASSRNGTLYIGVTSQLAQRAYLHRTAVVPSFTSSHRIARLVYFEQHVEMRDAISREKQLKKWRRAWKIRLIESFNPYWRDLWFDLI